MSTKNPRGNPGNKAPVIRVKHVIFIAQHAANGFNAGECHRELEREFKLGITYNGVRHYYESIRKYGARVGDALEGKEDVTESDVRDAVLALKPKSAARLVPLFLAYFLEKRLIERDPTYDIAYANKRRRLMKLSQNIEELDKEKVTAKGSFPTVKHADGSMEFQPFDIRNKDHAEQRKHIETMDQMVEGEGSGTVIIQVVDQAPSEESKTEEERRREKRMADVKAKRDAGKPATSEPKEEGSEK